MCAFAKKEQYLPSNRFHDRSASFSPRNNASSLAGFPRKSETFRLFRIFCNTFAPVNFFQQSAPIYKSFTPDWHSLNKTGLLFTSERVWRTSRRATISDVAHIAGVSKSTVSNVFNGKRPISKVVSERCWKRRGSFITSPTTLEYDACGCNFVRARGETLLCRRGSNVNDGHKQSDLYRAIRPE